jgi:transposase
MNWYIDTLLEQKKDHKKKSWMPAEIRNYLITRLPQKMLCSSSLKTENPISYILDKHIALKNEHIQPNHENMWNFIIIDDDVNSPDAFLDLPVPVPNMIVINPESGHCQRWYFLANGVSRTSLSKCTIQDYYLKTLFKLTAIYHGDAAYNGNLARNPFYHKHICLYPRLKPYTLNELNNLIGVSQSDYEKGNLDQSEAFLRIQEYCRKNKKMSDNMGAGRNCTIFDVLRVKAYKIHHEYGTETDFANDLQFEAQKINQNYFPNNLLPHNELKHISKSIARYCFTKLRNRQFSSSFIKRQKVCGALGGEARSSKYEEARQKCFELYTQDSSLKVSEIAQKCDVSERTIRSYLKEIKKQKESTVELVYYSNYTNEQLAALWGVSVRTVQRRRAAAKLEAKAAVEQALLEKG